MLCGAGRSVVRSTEKLNDFTCSELLDLVLVLVVVLPLPLDKPWINGAVTSTNSSSTNAFILTVCILIMIDWIHGVLQRMLFKLEECVATESLIFSVVP